MDGRRMTLDDAIAALYAREINYGRETFWDGGIKIWIGDTMNGLAAIGLMAIGVIGYVAIRATRT